MPKITTLSDGTKVSNQGLWTVCEKCHELKPMSQVGFRRMEKPDGLIARQPQCTSCRPKK
jgi:hypothetical protein